jgi:hypothetical protein
VFSLPKPALRLWVWNDRDLLERAQTVRSARLTSARLFCSNARASDSNAHYTPFDQCPPPSNIASRRSYARR